MANIEKSSLLEMVYPVGSIYMSVNATSPSALFGGTWVKIEGRFLLGSGGGYSLGATGGEAQHTLSEAELPEITAGFQTHGAEKGSIFYSPWGHATGTRKDNIYQTTVGLVQNGAYCYTNPGIKFGGSQAHNNMPPYLAVNIWKRTA